MPRSRFTLRVLLVAMLVVAAFFGGVRFERERQRREDLERERLAFEAEGARMIDELRTIQVELSAANARLQKMLQEFSRARPENAQPREDKMPVIHFRREPRFDF